MVDIQLAVADTEAALGALGFLNTHTKEGNLVEQTIQTAQGAQKPAEEPEDEDAAQEDADHQQELPGEQGTQHGEITGVDLVGKEADTAFQSAGRTDVLAESGQGNVPESIHDGDDKDKEHQNHIFQIRQQPGDGSLLHLRRGDLIQQLLNQTKGADPAADHTAEENAVQQQDAADIIDGTVVSGEGTLQRTQGTGTHSTGTGIAVDTGCADDLAVTLIDTAGNEALQVGIQQKTEVQLHDFALGGQIFLNGIAHISHPNPMHSVQILTALVSTSAEPPAKSPKIRIASANSAIPART